jgi:hypothetical protein
LSVYPPFYFLVYQSFHLCSCSFYSSVYFFSFRLSIYIFSCLSAHLCMSAVVYSLPLTPFSSFHLSICPYIFMAIIFLSVCLPIFACEHLFFLSICLLFHLSICPSFYMLINLSLCLPILAGEQLFIIFVCLPFHLSICPYIYLSICLCLFVSPSFYSCNCSFSSSLYPSFHLFICPSIYFFICLSVHLSICPIVLISLYISISSFVPSLHLAICPFVLLHTSPLYLSSLSYHLSLHLSISPLVQSVHSAFHSSFSLCVCQIAHPSVGLSHYQPLL